MDRSLSLDYTPSKNAILPKKCKFCHQFMEIKQINLTEAVRQCYKCSTPLQQLDTGDIELFHRSYLDVDKNPADWNPKVSTEEDELNKLGSWIEQFNLTVDKYDESSSDDEMTSKYLDFSPKQQDAGGAVNGNELRSNGVPNKCFSNSHSDLQGQYGWNIDAIEELDAALAKASAENSDANSLPFSLDDLFLPREQELLDHAPSVIAADSAVERNVSVPPCYEISEQVYLSETSGTFVQGPDAMMLQGSDSLSDALNRVSLNIGETCSITEDNCHDKKSTISLENSADTLVNTLPVVSACVESQSSSFEEGDETHSPEMDEAILVNKTVFENSSDEQDSTIFPVQAFKKDSMSISIPNVNNGSGNTSPCTEVLVNNNAYDSEKKKTYPTACILSTVTPQGILLTLPSALLTTDAVQANLEGSGNLVCEHVCDCDDASFQLSSPTSGVRDNQCLNFELPPLLFDEEKIIEENRGGKTSVKQSDVEKVLFSTTQLVFKKKSSPSLKKSSRKLNFNSDDSIQDECKEHRNSSDLVFTTEHDNTVESSAFFNSRPSDSCSRILFTIPAENGTSGSVSCQDIVVSVPVDNPVPQTDSYLNIVPAPVDTVIPQSDFCSNILVTVPADSDITESMLQLFSLDDLPILIGCADGDVTPVCLNNLQNAPPVEVALQSQEEMNEGWLSLHEEYGTSEMPHTSPSPALEEFFLDSTVGDLNYSSVSDNNSTQSIGSSEPMELQFSPNTSSLKRDEDTSISTNNAINSVHEVPIMCKADSRIYNHDKTFDENRNAMAVPSEKGSVGSISDDASSTFHTLVDQPLRLLNHAAEDDDDDLGSFTGAKFRPLGFRKPPMVQDLQVLNFAKAVRGEVRSCSPEKKNRKKFH